MSARWSLSIVSNYADPSGYFTRSRKILNDKDFAGRFAGAPGPQSDRILIQQFDGRRLCGSTVLFAGEAIDNHYLDEIIACR